MFNKNIVHIWKNYEKCLSPMMAFGVKTNKPPLFQMDEPFQVKHPLHYARKTTKNRMGPVPSVISELP